MDSSFQDLSPYHGYSCEVYQDPASQLSTVKFDATFKMILIGNSGVGKSCIIKRIGQNSFSEEHEVTIGAEFTTIAAHMNKKSFIKMQIWDSCGQERFNSITRIFYRGSQCVLLVYEVNNIQTLRDLESVWIKDIHSSLRDAVLILVGNKADVDDDEKTKSMRQVTSQEAQKFAQRHNINYFTEVSAKTARGIKELVEYMAKSVYHKNKDNMVQYMETEGNFTNGTRRSSSQSQQSGNNIRSPNFNINGGFSYMGTQQSFKSRGSSKKIHGRMNSKLSVNKKSSCC